MLAGSRAKRHRCLQVRGRLQDARSRACDAKDNFTALGKCFEEGCAMVVVVYCRFADRSDVEICLTQVFVGVC